MQYPISTYTGKHFDPYFAKKADICVEDIAHAQSLMVRANGHLPEFYSVAQHSIACCNEALARQETAQTTLFCLLHDAAEAYMSDVTRPVKARMPEYAAAEETLLKTIFDALVGAQPNEAQQKTICAIDNAMLKAEFLHCKQEKMAINTQPLIQTPSFETVPFKQAEAAFLALYRRLKSMSPSVKPDCGEQAAKQAPTQTD